MPPERQPGSPKDWLRYAYSDLELAGVSPPCGVMLEHLCFHAQQAAEKGLKAVLVSCRIAVPRTHSIRMLLDLLPDTFTVPERVEDAASLTDYAVMGRYPGDTEPVDDEEYKEAIRLAKAVISWTEQVIGH